MGKRNYLVKAKRSRKMYIPIYLFVLVLVGGLFYLFYLGFKFNKFVIFGSIIFMFFLLKYTEYHRFKDWWAITENSFIESKGLFNKNVREVGFSKISDLDISQPFFKRILGYGNVNLRLFINETSICVNNINFPEDFADLLQEKIGGVKIDA